MRSKTIMWAGAGFVMLCGPTLAQGGHSSMGRPAEPPIASGSRLQGETSTLDTPRETVPAIPPAAPPTTGIGGTPTTGAPGNSGPSLDPAFKPR